AALAAWLGVAVIGHAHSVVLFFAYKAVGARGVTTGGSGRPLLCAGLLHRPTARLTLAVAAAGYLLAVAGAAAASRDVLAVGGATVAAAGVLVTANLATGPRRAVRAGGPAMSS